MRLRARLQDALRARLAALLPEAMTTVWDHQSVVVAIEKLDFKPSGGIRDHWESCASFSGVVRVELRADGIDTLPVEALLSDLLLNRMHIAEDATVPVGALSETASVTLLDLRDTLTDQQVATGLRLGVTGLIVRRAVRPAPIAAVMVGSAPDIGPGHEADYHQIGGGA